MLHDKIFIIQLVILGVFNRDVRPYFKLYPLYLKLSNNKKKKKGMLLDEIFVIQLVLLNVFNKDVRLFLKPYPLYL